MSNHIFINLDKTTRHDRNLNEVYTCYGYSIADDYGATYNNTYDSIDELVGDIGVFLDDRCDDLCIGLVRFAYRDSEEGRMIIASGVENDTNFTIMESRYSAETISKYIEE